MKQTTPRGPKRTVVVVVVSVWAVAVIGTATWALSRRGGAPDGISEAPPTPFEISVASGSKDGAVEWLREWIARRGDGAVPASECGGTTGVGCVLPRHVAARESPKKPLKIPRIIWQTWKSNTVGPVQFKAMSSFIRANPDFEYVLFDDADCWEFMCRFADERARKAWELVRPGAAKADVWRLVVIWYFGGVYIDSDASSVRPLSDIFEHDSSVVSGIGRKGDLHQWFLAYTPKHPIIGEALKAVAKSAISTFEERRWAKVIHLTGPTVFQNGGVAPVLRRNGCTVNRRDLESDGSLQLAREGVPCKNTDNPEHIGKIQIFGGDFLGGNIVFKVDGIDNEKATWGVMPYQTYRSFNMLFDAGAVGRCERMMASMGWS